MHKIDFIYSKKRIHYQKAIELMKHKVRKIIEKQENQAIWLLEHHNVYTFGRSAEMHDIIKNLNIPIFHTDRGGKITYHGPGQEIIYVMLNLKEIFGCKPDIRLFISMLGTWIIDLLHHYEMCTYFDNNSIGIWTKNGKKIASIGIRVSQGVSYHGIALNINPVMNFFSYINPCGMEHKIITSFFEEKNFILDPKDVRNNIKKLFFQTFGLKFNLKLGHEYKI